MTDPLGRPLPAEFLNGVALPVGKPKRLLVVDRTGIEAQVWPDFNTVDVLIDCATPIVYTMARRNLLRLNETIAAAVAGFERFDEREGGR
ncbi:hypothetical protein [Saccharopolyspora spinosa]|uniref:Uncharacterized protein n=1 Tax=Saccharopolyspora spinosa TaxID=60894 RepID=A0A2N3XRI9_SACSN|nr:hypothetical protein [Saccharopolyspora spinosa]PKW13297.1 hypothetical protein A8926_0808 [Saccharopolyspora spinosa]